MQNAEQQKSDKPSKSHKTQIILAIIGLLGAVLPGVLTIVYLVLDRTLPLPEGSEEVEESANVESIKGERSVFKLLEEDADLGAHRHVILDEDGQMIDVVQQNGQWMTKSNYLEQRIAPAEAAK